MDYSAPTILRLQALIPSIQSTLFIVQFCTIFVIVLRKDKNKRKEGHIRKKLFKFDKAKSSNQGKCNKHNVKTLVFIL